VLVGWSLGAQLALHIAAQHPHKAARLVLIAATPRFVQAPDWPAALPAATLADFRADFDTTPTPPSAASPRCRRGDAAAATSPPPSTPPSPPPTTPTGRPRHRPRLLADTDLRASIGSVPSPCASPRREDRLMPAAAAEWLADALPDGRLSVFGLRPRALLSRPADCAALISFARD
jgi:pimeloyl-[acyl-carrier protein] methyl ester esterase